MKTLIFLGAARKNGRTRQMVEELNRRLDTPAEVIDCYRLKNISPCLDCRYCWKTRGCAVRDGMQEIYQKIDEAQCIILAAPVYFYTVPAPMKLVMDRCQIYWARNVRKDDGGREKIGGIMLVGGAPSFENQFTAAEIPMKGLLTDLNARCLGVVTLSNSDAAGLDQRPDVQQEIAALAEKINAQESWT
ncbi:MAG: flavodoxin family protein [Eubacteriales bacterium]|nr:flavodoxin family protein [Eubacteriales bacterium]